MSKDGKLTEEQKTNLLYTAPKVMKFESIGELLDFIDDLTEEQKAELIEDQRNIMDGRFIQ